MILQLGVPSSIAAASVVGMAALAAVLAAIVAAAYRWYTGDRVQEGLAVLVGLSAVAIYLNTTTAIGQFIGGGAGLFDLETALGNVVTFALAAGTALVGRTVGDRLAMEASVLSGRRELEADVSRLVTSVGRVIAVTLPEVIEDIEGYDPVPPETKDALAGQTLLFPRRLSVAELHDRLRTRLADDHGIGHVDVEFRDDASVEFLAVGSRAAGIGPTLAPGTAAVALQADPAYAASSGDVVELWQSDGNPELIAVGELRGTAGDVVTVALDESDAYEIDTDVQYRLITRSATPRADREFAGVLRAAEETMSAVTVEPGSALMDTPLAETEVTVVAVKPADGHLLAVPPRTRLVASGDIIYAVGRPAALRGLESAAAAPEPEPSS